MDIVFTRLSDTAATFTLKGTTPAFSNAFRRAMIGEVPTLAIEEVFVYENDSALFDEMLAHRLGLIPLKTDLDSYIPRAECSCNGEGCSRCCAIYTLSVEGPKMVHSSDLIPQDPESAPVDGNIPIVKLVEGQKLVLEARAEINIGKEHAKWQPTVACGYKNYPFITVDDRCDACGMCVDECPRGVLQLGRKTVEVVDGNLENCSLCKLCERACVAGGIGEIPAIHVAPDDTRNIFVVESTGGLAVKEIMKQALLCIKMKTDNLVDALNEISGEAGYEESS